MAEHYTKYTVAHSQIKPDVMRALLQNFVKSSNKVVQKKFQQQSCTTKVWYDIAINCETQQLHGTCTEHVQPNMNIHKLAGPTVTLIN